MRHLIFLTRALMIALSYEIAFKLMHMLTPSLFEESAVAVITRPLGVLVGVIMILFLLAFYRVERSHRGLARALQLLIAFTILAFVLRLPPVQDWFDFRTVRLSSEVVGLVRSALFIIVLILFHRTLAGSDGALRYVAIFLAVLIGIGAVVNLVALGIFVNYLNSGTSVAPALVVTMLIVLLFLLTRLAAIYFLYRFEKHELRQPSSFPHQAQ